MRILHVIASVDPKTGGPIEGLRQRSRVLKELGHEVEVCSLDAPDAPFIAELGLVVHAMGPGKGAYQFSPRLVPWLMENVNRYDGLVVNGIWQYHSYAAHRAFRRVRRDYFVFTHGMLDPWFNEAYPLKRIKKLLYWFWGEHPVLRDARAVLFTTEEERRLARTSFWPYRIRERVVSYGVSSAPEPIDSAKEAFREIYPDLADRPFLLFLSRVHEKKGCDLLLNAFVKVSAQYPEHILVIAGPDQKGLVGGLAASAKAAGVGDRVRFPGMLKGDQKWGAFASAEAFVLPSHQENFGIVVAEALATGTPVLISNKVNIWREVLDAGAGFVEDDDQAGTDRLLERWLSAEPDVRSTMREAAVRCFRTHFSVEQSAQSLLDVFASS